MTKGSEKRLKQMLAGGVFGIGFAIILNYPELDYYWKIPLCLLMYYGGWLSAKAGPRVYSPNSETGKLTGII